MSRLLCWALSGRLQYRVLLGETAICMCIYRYMYAYSHRQPIVGIYVFIYTAAEDKEAMRKGVVSWSRNESLAVTVVARGQQ